MIALWRDGWWGRTTVLLLAFAALVLASVPFVIAASVAESNEYQAKCRAIGGDAVAVRNVKTSTRYCVRNGLLVEVK